MYVGFELKLGEYVPLICLVTVDVSLYGQFVGGMNKSSRETLLYMDLNSREF